MRWMLTASLCSTGTFSLLSPQTALAPLLMLRWVNQVSRHEQGRAASISVSDRHEESITCKLNTTVTELRVCQLLCSPDSGGRLGLLVVGRGSAEEETPGSHLRPAAWCRLHPPAAKGGPVVRPRPLLARQTSTLLLAF